MIREGSKVQWNWGSGNAEGKVIETHKKSITKQIKGNSVTRNGEEGNKALYIEQKDGDKVLKLESEVSKV